MMNSLPHNLTTEDKVLLSQTIAAFATPPGESGLAVLRLSGPAAELAVSLCFQPGKRFPAVREMPGYSIAFGSWRDQNGQKLDEVLVSCFRAPQSYTGEDVFEVSCHGGQAVRRNILRSLLDLGVSAAGPGEFSRRAYINGKMDLPQAEAVMDLIRAESDLQEKLAVDQLGGKLSERLNGFCDRLYELLSVIELILEFPEQEYSLNRTAGLLPQIESLEKEIKDLLETYRSGRIVREGLQVVLCGAPNAGKSSLLNALLGHDRALVSAEPGTTRDSVDARILLGGLQLVLVDTAGLRESEHSIERAGIERARRIMTDSEVLVWLFAADEEVPAETVLEEIAAHAKDGKQLILALSKADRPEAAAMSAALVRALDDHLDKAAYGGQVLQLSSVCGTGLNELKTRLYEIGLRFGSTAAEGLLLSNARHKQLLDQSLEQIENARRLVVTTEPLEIVSVLLRSALEILGGINGSEVSEELADEIFSRFCVGK